MVRRLLILALLAACSPTDRPAEPAADGPIRAWQRSLADPNTHAIRDGLKIDDAAFQTAILTARVTHRDHLAARWNADLAALAHGPVPAEPAYRTIASFPSASTIGEPFHPLVEATHQLGDRDLHGTLRRYLSMYLPLTLTTELQMPVETVGRWLAFLGLAEPTITRCGPSDLCMSYGDLDVFVFNLVPYDGAHVVGGFRWLQRAAKP